MDWRLVVGAFYLILLVLVSLRIIYEIRSTPKALAYMLVVIFIPLLGMFIYFSFGNNYRKRKLYDRKLVSNVKEAETLKKEILEYSKDVFDKNGALLEPYKELAFMLAKEKASALTSGNQLKLLVNGEQKFPEVFEALKQAKDHIHIEYYIYEDDETGRALASILMKKAKEGVEVRFIYDDFGSRGVRKKLVPEMKKAGVKAFPFYRVIFWILANRINYRNHRKIIVIDGKIGFVGGINVSDKYVNKKSKKKKLFWRDTHLMIEGPGILQLQRIFLSDWNFCASDNQEHNERFFPKPQAFPLKKGKIVQIASSGPDSDTPIILFSLLQAINHAEEEILITTPYFIPSESILDALQVSAMGGVKVKLLVPGISDSKLVNAAARSYYDDLLAAGVEIYLYKKGFVHAKTLVTDRKLAVVGTANLDFRSLALNFEVNAIVYDKETACELADIFFEDIKYAEQINSEEWLNRKWDKLLGERAARLVSPLL